MEEEVTPLTVDPELKRKWNRVLELDQQIAKSKSKLGEKLNELNGLKRELGIND